MRLLVVEDEPGMAKFIAKGLREQSYAVDVAHTGLEALNQAHINDYDVFVLDVNLPAKDGFSVCRELRTARVNSPILLLTAFNDPEDIVCGLNCGADDYLTKPFEFSVLLARIRALLRRVQQDTPKMLNFHDLHLNTLNHTAARGSRSIRLTAREYALIELFMLRPGQLLRREAIAQYVWNESFDPFSNIIDVYVNRLRKKIDSGCNVHLLHTIRNQGYVLSDLPPPADAHA